METVKIWDKEIPYYDEAVEKESKENQNTNEIRFFSAKTDERVPTVVIFPGGAYCRRASEREGDRLAKFYSENGINAAVVEYRVKPYHYPAELLDAQRAIKVIRSHEKDWNIDTDKIIALGFSAGGHLCGMTATMPDICNKYGDELDALSARPNGAILCYAVSSSDEEFGHKGSFNNLLGEDGKLYKHAFSTEKLIDENTCPCFLWHTAADNSVSVINTLRFAEQLSRHNVPFEAHIFPIGGHGTGMAREVKGASQWPELSLKWINNFIK